MEIFLFSAS